MSWQSVATAIAVACALAYLVYKLVLASRPPRRPAGPDVPISRLVSSGRKGRRRAPRSPRERDPGCH